MKKWKFLAVRNWRRFQHYRDRCPPWIKLHAELLEDPEFAALADRDKAALMLTWLLAARTGNKIPNDPQWIRRRIGLKRKPNVQALVRARFLIEWTSENELAENKPVEAPDASTVQAERTQSAVPESESEAEAEAEKEELTDLPTEEFLATLRELTGVQVTRIRRHTEGARFVVGYWRSHGRITYLHQLYPVLDAALSEAEDRGIRTPKVLWKCLHALKARVKPPGPMSADEHNQHYYRSRRAGTEAV